MIQQGPLYVFSLLIWDMIFPTAGGWGSVFGRWSLVPHWAWTKEGGPRESYSLSLSLCIIYIYTHTCSFIYICAEVHTCVCIYIYIYTFMHYAYYHQQLIIINIINIVVIIIIIVMHYHYALSQFLAAGGWRLSWPPSARTTWTSICVFILCTLSGP